MKRFFYFALMQVCAGTALYAQTPVLTNVSSNPGANLNVATDDFIQFNLLPTAPVATYVEPYTYALTATQNGNPVTVTLQSGTPANNVKYFANGFAPGFKLANGTSGNGNVILTITPNWGSFPSTTVTITDPGANAGNNTCGTKTVSYSFTSDRKHTDFEDYAASIPKFNAINGKTLISANVAVSMDVFASIFQENASTSPQSIYRYGLHNQTDLSLNGNSIISSPTEMVYGTPGYPNFTSIPANVHVPPTGTWAGDSLTVSGPVTPQPSTILGMRGVSNSAKTWLTETQYVGLNARLDPRWVENATGNTSGALIQDMFIVPPTVHNFSNSTTLTTANPALSQFIGTGNVPLLLNSTVSIASVGGGGNIVGSMVTSGAFKVTVTYTYTEECFTLSGNVFNDGNGNTDNLVNHTYSTGTGLGSPESSQLHANLLDEDGNVIATAAVNATTGAYTFANVTGSATYTVQISTNQGVVGNAAPATALPSRWYNTNEQWGTTPNTNLDNTPANIDGAKTITMNGANASDVNFGINKTPTAENKNYSFTSTPTSGTIIALDGTNSTYGATPGLLSGDDREDGAKGGPTSKFVINSLPTNGTLLYNGNPITAAQVTAGFEFTNPALLSFQFTGSGYNVTTFTYSFIDDAGFKGTLANYSINLASPLPLDLLSFTATAKSCNAYLNWKTATEDNVSRFEIEMGTDGKQFTNIATVAAGGSDYQYLHLQKEATAFYSLKMLDSDGAFTYSATAKVSTQCDDNNFTVYPNPASNSINIKGLEAGSRIVISNAIGQEVINIASSGQSLQTLDISKLSNGVYTLTVVNNTKESTTIKFSKKN